MCQTEDEARALIDRLNPEGKWPCLFSVSDTTGEKDTEEFFTDEETIDITRFENLGVIKNEASYNESLLEHFETKISEMKNKKQWTKTELVDLFHIVIPDFKHKETGKYLDGKM